MKTLTLSVLAFAMLFLLTQCNNPAPEKLCSNADTRGEIISVLMNNDDYMNQVMDSMRTKHPDVLLSSVFVIAKDDRQMQEGMMDNMNGMCKMDSSSCKMMMGKTMDMCDMDPSTCNMMIGSIQSHPNVKKAVQEGMCGMKGM